MCAVRGVWIEINFKLFAVGGVFFVSIKIRHFSLQFRVEKLIIQSVRPILTNFSINFPLHKQFALSPHMQLYVCCIQFGRTEIGDSLRGSH